MQSVFKNFAITFCVSLIVFALIALLIIGVVRDNLIPGGSDTPDDTGEVTGTVSGDNPGVQTPDDDTIKKTATSFTVLIVGDDYLPDVHKDYDPVSLNAGVSGFPIRHRKIITDTLILVNIDGANKIASFCSLPNNLCVSYKGGTIAIGELYEKEGLAYLCDAIKGLTGVTIDYYVHTTMPALEEIVNDIGGVTYTVPVDMYYKDESQGLEINLKKGLQTLDGAKAIQLLRYTSYNNGNSQRMAIGIDFLRAMISSVIDYNTVDSMSALFTTLSQHVVTNFTVEDIVKHFSALAAYPEYTLSTVTYPATAKSNDGVDQFEPSISEALLAFSTWRS